MTYLTKPKLHHPALPKNKLGFTHRDYEGSGFDPVRRLRARFDLGRDHPGVLRAGHRAASRGQAFRHRLLVEDADVFSRQLAWLQQRARTHAIGADRRQSGQSRADLSRCLGRRRLGIDRPRAVRAFDAPRRQHGLHRREQRRLRSDQGTVLGDGRQGLQGQARRDQQRRAHRHGDAGPAARRDAASREASPATRRSWCR